MIIVSLRLTTFESTSPKFAYVLQPLEVANTHHPHIILCPRFRATAMCIEWESTQRSRLQINTEVNHQ